MEFVAAQLRRWGPSIGGLILMIVGLGGAPDDLRVWGNWIGDFVGGDSFQLLLVAFGIAIIVVANVPGLRRLAMAAWHITVGADSSPVQPAPAYVTLGPPMEVRFVQGANNGIHLEVKNNTETDYFVAQVTKVEGSGHVVPWSIKWCDVVTEERRILSGGTALLDLARAILPVIELLPEGHPIGSLDHVTKGHFRLYSISQPEGFDTTAISLNLYVEPEREMWFVPIKLTIRISGLSQPANSVAKTVSLGFRTYAKNDGRSACKPEVTVS